MNRTRRRFLVFPLLLLAIGVLVAPASGRLVTAGSSSIEHENEAITYRGSTACGVERWSVKTGTDTDARSVSLARVTSTNLIQLRSLHAPGTLPTKTRVKPTETTVFRVTAYLIRFKKEQDSDYHLVLADAGGRTIIAEIPAPDCVGKNSSFLTRIQTVRSQFDRRYSVTDSWRRLKVGVEVTGVGFFDFKHGQSGVAPNAIELHPVLSLTFGKSVTQPSPPPPPTKTPSGSGFTVRASVSPSRMSHDAHPTLTVKTTPGASCSASVVYSTGGAPRRFDTSVHLVGASGTVTWNWHEQTSGSGGTAMVTCSYRGQSKTATALFTVR